MGEIEKPAAKSIPRCGPSSASVVAVGYAAVICKKLLNYLQDTV